MPFTTRQLSHDSPWTPSPYTAFKVLLSARLAAAVWSNISDCDETFNYWEPTHHLLYGHGLQTWEYDPRWVRLCAIIGGSGIKESGIKELPIGRLIIHFLVMILIS